MLGNILDIIKERYTLEKIDAKEFSRVYRSLIISKIFPNIMYTPILH